MKFKISRSKIRTKKYVIHKIENIPNLQRVEIEYKTIRYKLLKSKINICDYIDKNFDENMVNKFGEKSLILWIIKKGRRITIVNYIDKKDEEIILNNIAKHTNKTNKYNEEKYLGYNQIILNI